MPRKLTYITLILFALLLSFCHRQESGKIDKASELLSQNRLDEARKYLEFALSESPENLDLLYLYGWSLMLSGDNDSALAYFGRCLQKDPRFYGGHNGLGALYLRKKNLELAEKEFNLALKARPDLAEIYGNLSEVKYQQNKWAEAKTLLEKARDLQPKRADDRLRLARVLARMDDLDQAEHLLAEAKDLPFTNPALKNQQDCLWGTVIGRRIKRDTQSQKNLSSAQEKDLLAAREALIRCEKADPTRFHEQETRGMIAESFSHQTSSAMKRLMLGLMIALPLFLAKSSFADNPPTIEMEKRLPPPITTRKFFSPHGGGTDLGHIPDDVSGAFKAAQIQGAAGHYPEAAQLFLQAAERFPFFPEAYTQAGLAYELMGELKKAETLQKKALSQWPEFQEARFNLANTYFKQESLPQAEKAYLKVLQLNPDHTEAHSNLGALYLRSGDLEKAEMHLQKALALKPTFIDAQMHQANLYFEKAQYEKALELNGALLKLRPQEVLLIANRGHILSAMGHYDEAKTQYDQALKLMPHFAEAYYGLGLMAFWQKQDASAEKHFYETLKYAPKHRKTLFWLASLQERSGKKDAAQQSIATLQRLLTTYPDFNEARFNLVLLYQKTGRFADAQREVESLKKRDPQRYKELTASQ